MGAPEVVIPITTLLCKEVNFKGSFRYGVSSIPSSSLNTRIHYIIFIAW